MREPTFGKPRGPDIKGDDILIVEVITAKRVDTILNVSRDEDISKARFEIETCAVKHVEMRKYLVS